MSRTNDNESQCCLCENIAIAVSQLLSPATRTGRLSATVFLGELASAKRNCQTCARLDVLRRRFCETPDEMETHIWDPGCYVQLMCNSWNYGSIYCEFRDGNDNSITGSMFLVPSSSQGPNLERWLNWDPLWIDLRRLRSWITHCDVHHHDNCHDLDVIRSPTRLILIDVEKQCLVTISLPTNYATLSYVWGETDKTLKTTTANVDRLQQPNALQTLRNLSPLPTTIRDAIHLTASLGIPYLWVDRLCIIQDDLESKAIHIQAMGSIYHHAYITIIAADGTDANHGIRGVGNGSYPRNSEFLESRRLEFSPTCRMAAAVVYSDPLDDYEDRGKSQICWNQRAWTYQERILSKRSIIFCRGTVFWECLTCLSYEEFAGEPEGVMTRRRSSNSMPLPFGPTLWPDLREFAALVLQYNNRSLTFEGDALDAFTAILNSLSFKFEDGFFFGLPEAFFDIGL